MTAVNVIQYVVCNNHYFHCRGHRLLLSFLIGCPASRRLKPLNLKQIIFTCAMIRCRETHIVVIISGQREKTLNILVAKKKTNVFVFFFANDTVFTFKFMQRLVSFHAYTTVRL